MTVNESVFLIMAQTALSLVAVAALYSIFFFGGGYVRLHDGIGQRKGVLEVSGPLCIAGQMRLDYNSWIFGTKRHTSRTDAELPSNCLG